MESNGLPILLMDSSWIRWMVGRYKLMIYKETAVGVNGWQASVNEWQLGVNGGRVGVNGR